MCDGRTIGHARRRHRWRLREQVVEPVFGQARAFRHVVLRGFHKAYDDRPTICIPDTLPTPRKAPA
jgi:hypothetical protein